MNLSNFITSDDILGKNVIDPDGNFVGVADKLLIDSVAIEVLGISVDKGFLSNGVVIGKDYIERVTNHAIFLKEVPVINVVGKLVFDANGKTIGTITKVTMKDNKNIIDTITVKTSTFGKTEDISGSKIHLIGKNVILK